MLRKLLDAHRFFCRKSQHYVMGNWNEYESWFTKRGFNRRKLFYVSYFPIAYMKFMYYTVCD